MSHIKTLFGGKIALLLAVAISFSLQASAQALSGSYTIGGASPDYATIDAAVTDLETNGVSAAVTFNIRTGTYTEHLSLGEVSGTSASNTVTFQAESGDSTDVTITYAATSSSDAWTFRIDSADYIALKHLTIENTANMGTAVVWIQGEAHNIEISNCALTGPSDLYYSQYSANIYSPSDTKDTATTVMNCLIVGNDKGVHLRGTYPSAFEEGHVVSGNTIVNSALGAVEFYGAINVTCHDNVVDQNSSGSGLTFTFINGNLSVQGNKIVHDTIGGTGLWFNGASVTGAQIYNNYIYGHPTNGYGNSRGISFSSTGASGSGFNVYHNTIDIAGAEEFYDACVFSQFSSGTNSIHFQNNVLRAQNGLVYNIMDPSSFGTMDYNGTWSTGDAFAIWGTDATLSLAELQSASGKEANSVAAPPFFAAEGDFHLTAAGGYDGGGTSLIADVPFDCDGEARNASAPDMGCDEFSSPATELAMLSIDSLGANCGDTAHIYATVQNLGSAAANNPILEWSVNGAIQGSVYISDTLQPGEAGSFYLGTITQTAGVTFNVMAWPDTLGGSNTENDTAFTTFSRGVAGGTYTIGGASPDFNTISDAATAITNGGICGPVVFNIRSGSYTEQVCVGNVLGASASNTIIFQSESGDSTDVVVTYGATTETDNFVWKFDGSDYVTLRNITVEPTGSTYGRAVVLDGGASQFTMNNCDLRSDTAQYQAEGRDIFYGVGPFHDDLSIHNNRFHLGYRAIKIGDAFNNPERASGVMVYNNVCLNNGYSGVTIENMDAPKVMNNYISSNAPIPGFAGVTLYQCVDSVHIIGNEVYVNEPNAQYGIQIWASEGTSSERIVVANNAVSMPLGIYGTFAIEVGSNNKYSDVFNNTSYVRDVGQSSPSSYALSVWGWNSRVYNNNCYNEAGYAFNLFFNTVLDSANNNNYYSSSGTAIYANFADQTLATYQALVGGEANTVQVKPKFAAWNNLRANVAELDDAGHTLPALATDITGAARNMATPDIGAYEFTYVPFVCPKPGNLRTRRVQDVSARLVWNTVPGATGYKIYLKVAGNPTWDTIAIKHSNQGSYQFNGLTPGTTYKWTVATHCGAECEWSDPVLPHARFVTLNVPCADPSAISTSPVGTDKARLNWTPSVNSVNNIIRWREQGNPTWMYKWKDGNKDNHWLTGLSAGTAYEWQVQTRCAVNNDSNSPWSTLQTFSTLSPKSPGDAGEATNGEPVVLLYPNPVSDQLNLFAVQPDASGTINLQLFDGTGRLVLSRQVALVSGQANTTFDVSNLKQGIYLVRITGAAQWTDRLVVN